MDDKSKLIKEFFSELFDEKEFELLNIANESKLEDEIVEDVIIQEEVRND